MHSLNSNMCKNKSRVLKGNDDINKATSFPLRRWLMQKLRRFICVIYVCKNYMYVYTNNVNVDEPAHPAVFIAVYAGFGHRGSATPMTDFIMTHNS